MWQASTIGARALLRYIRSVDHPAKIRIVRQVARWSFADGVPLTADTGPHIKVEVDDFVGWAILREGAYEPYTLARAAKILANGGTLVDVGANIGLFTTYLGVLPRVRCVSIEPHPSNFLKLRRNVRLNPSANVACSHLALSSKEELLDLEEINPGNSGTVRVYSADAYATKETFTVAACTLQQVLENAKLQGVTLLKIDVEGFEFSVLEGLNWQGQYRPQNVLIEFSDYTARFRGSGRKSLAHFFLEKGYVGYTVQGQPLSPTESTVEDNAWFRDKALTAERQG